MRTAFFVLLLVAPLACKKERAAPPEPACTTDAVGTFESITLERTECYGFCPAYEVTLSADGAMTWVGKHHVETPSAKKQVDRDQVRAVAEEAVKACFYQLKDDYEVPITDQSAAKITLRTSKGGTKTIRVYPADEDPRSKDPMAAPHALYALVSHIDKVADVKPLIGKGNVNDPRP